MPVVRAARVRRIEVFIFFGRLGYLALKALELLVGREIREDFEESKLSG